MDMPERIAKVKQIINNIVTDFDKPDEVIHAALTEIINHVGPAIASLPDARVAFETVTADRSNALANAKTAIIASGGQIPAPVNAAGGVQP